MSIRKLQRSDRRFVGNIHGTRTASRLVLTLLFFAALSALAVAQGRYTVNRLVAPPLQPRESVPEPEYIPRNTSPIHWETDYENTRSTADISGRNLLIYLYADSITKQPEALTSVSVIPACRKFDTVILDDELVRAGLDQFMLLKLPMDAKITHEDGEQVSIYSLPGFEHMLGHPGLIVIDFANKDRPYCGEVVGILPFLRGECPTEKQMATFLNLPPGTLTQRTLTYAVRIHPDQPLSSNGLPLPIVVKEALDHALYQAERGVLGHQNFGARTQRIKEVLGSGSPSEICAQSQSGENLFEAAIACMRAWRYSSAHWSIARRNHTYYGYDMARGKNGAWYAVGFFID